MMASELLARAQGMGATLTVPEPDRIHIEAPEPLPGELVAALREHKAELLVLLSTEATWPPPDSEELLARWETQGCQEIPVSPGVSISNLRTWLYPDYPQDRLAEHLSAVRGWLIEGLPALEVEVDPLLERWRRMCLPQWREKLRDAGAAGDERGVEYAAYMLDLLGDDEATE